MAEQSLVPHDDNRQLSLWSDTPVLDSPFDTIRHYDENGQECWYARELAQSLGYSDWRNFKKVIGKAKTALKSIGVSSKEHVVGFNDDLLTKQGAVREFANFKLSRLACYHIAQEADASKPIVAAAKSYFLTQARKQELAQAERKSNAQLKRAQDITAYQLEGKNQDWAEIRVDSKDSHKVLTSTLQATHVTHEPNYGAVGAAINTDLFEMTRQQIVEYLGLLPKDAKSYRDHLGTYALDALRQVNYTSSARMKRLGRVLTHAEQVEIVQHVVRIVAPTMRELAQYARIDFISGAELDSEGKPLIARNLKLLGSGK